MLHWLWNPKVLFLPWKILDLPVCDRLMQSTYHENFSYVWIQLNSFVGSGPILILCRILTNPEMDIEMYYLQKERKRH